MYPCLDELTRQLIQTRIDNLEFKMVQEKVYAELPYGEKVFLQFYILANLDLFAITKTDSPEKEIDKGNRENIKGKT